MKPTIGRIVHYTNSDGVVLAAIVTHVFTDDTANLFVFASRGGNYPIQKVPQRKSTENWCDARGTWSWLARESEPAEKVVPPGPLGDVIPERDRMREQNTNLRAANTALHDFLDAKNAALNNAELRIAALEKEKAVLTERLAIEETRLSEVRAALNAEYGVGVKKGAK